jgi:hypothetical protein
MREAASAREAADNMVKALRAGRAGIRRDLDRLGEKLIDELKLDVSAPGQGRLYTTRFWTDRQGRLRRGGPRVPHRASAPGHPPAVDEGRLRASFGWKIDPPKQPGVDVLVLGTGDEKDKYLEFGTRDMKARPHWRPLINRNRDTIRDAVGEGVEGRERAQARRLGGKG